MTALTRFKSSFMKVNSSSMSVSRFRNLSIVLVSSSRLFAKPFFRLRQAFVDGGQDSDFLCDELLLHPFVLSGKALFNPFVLSGEFLIHGLQNHGCLLRQQFLDLRNYGRLPFFTMCGC